MKKRKVKKKDEGEIGWRKLLNWSNVPDARRKFYYMPWQVMGTFDELPRNFRQRKSAAQMWHRSFHKISAFCDFFFHEIQFSFQEEKCRWSKKKMYGYILAL